jgi:NADPH:quinone reductase-like Zn-dependent oxidoreductase
MQAIQMRDHGAPEVLELTELPVPVPGPGELRVRVTSAAVNFSDTMRRRNDPYPFPTALPFVPGGEVAGTVDALGAGVDGPPVGTRVLALAGPDGSTGYAQYALADARRVVPIPDGIDDATASTVLVAGVTPLLVLTHAARLQPGESVLVPAAAGGVGSYAVQLAEALGAGTVIALAGSEAKRAAALALGADHALDTADPAWPAAVRELTGGHGVDVALETVGGNELENTLRALAPFGRCVVIGYASREPATLGPEAIESLLYRPALNQSVTGFNIGAFFVMAPQVAGPAIGRLLGLLASGAVTVPIAHELPLARAADAHRLMESRQLQGKVVLRPWS